MDLKLGDSQIIIEECRKFGLSLQQAAYVMATAYWETARTMKPVEEAFWLSDSWRRRKLRYYPWHGRGYVQITWERNYRLAEAKLGIPFTKDPKLAMVSENAAKILVLGSKEGWFTGKKLSDYINSKGANYTLARYIINGRDKRVTIANLAVQYENALKAAGYRPRRSFGWNNK